MSFAAPIELARTVQLDTGMTMRLGYRCLTGADGGQTARDTLVEMERLLADEAASITDQAPARTGR